MTKDNNHVFVAYGHLTVCFAFSDECDCPRDEKGMTTMSWSCYTAECTTPGEWANGTSAGARRRAERHAATVHPGRPYQIVDIDDPNFDPINPPWEHPSDTP